MNKSVVLGAVVLGVGSLAFFSALLPDFAQSVFPKTEWESAASAQQRADRIWDFFNARPVSDASYRILFVGNSLTVHPGWKGVWDAIHGMAASTHEHDFVHRFSALVIAEQSPRPVEIFIEAGPGLKHALARLESSVLLSKRYDLIVLQRGENDKVFNREYRERYRELAATLSECGDRLLIVSDWSHPDRAPFQLMVAEALGAGFVDVTRVAADPANKGNGGPYNHQGVAGHPNDQGMAEIANMLIEVYKTSVYAER
jgi:hypothetical protein